MCDAPYNSNVNEGKQTNNVKRKDTQKDVAPCLGLTLPLVVCSFALSQDQSRSFLTAYFATVL